MPGTDEEYLREAIQEAQKAYTMGEVPVGAVVVDAGGEVLARAHNLCETQKDATAHAELLAIQAASEKLGRWRLAGATLYVTLEPCPMCAGAIVLSRLSRLVYGSPDSRLGAVESLWNIPLHPALGQQLEVRAGVLEEECAALLRQFFQERR